MILLLMGPPGSGKGTQASLISERFDLYHLTTGGMLREEIKHGTAVGDQVEPLLATGHFAPDAIVQQLVRDRIAKKGGKVLLDGYPRTEVQVEDLDEILGDRGESIDAIIFLDVPETVLRQRLAKRALEEGRHDDSDSVFPMRWEEYTTKTAKAIDCYRGKENFFRVDGDQTREEVFAEICSGLESLVVKQSRGL